MHERSASQSPWLPLGVVFGAVTLFGAYSGVAALLGPPGHDTAHPAVRETAFAAVVGWGAAVLLALDGRYRRASRRAAEAGLAAVWYTWGCALYLLHVAVAFHAAHGWSHAAAVGHVEAVSGFGPGLCVSYAFSLLWLLDVVALWWSPARYRDRPRWVQAAVHGFMAFVVFNATVVYGGETARPLGLIFFLVLVPLEWFSGERAEAARRKRDEGMGVAKAT